MALETEEVGAGVATLLVPWDLNHYSGWGVAKSESPVENGSVSRYVHRVSTCFNNLFGGFRISQPSTVSV